MGFGFAVGIGVAAQQLAIVVRAIGKGVDLVNVQVGVLVVLRELPVVVDLVAQQPACAGLGALQVVDTRLAGVQAAVNAAVGGVSDGAVSGQKSVGGRAIFMLHTAHQGERCPGRELHRDAGRQVVALHIGLALQAVFLARLGDEAVVHRAITVGDVVVVHAQAQAAVGAYFGVEQQCTLFVRALGDEVDHAAGLRGAKDQRVRAFEHFGRFHAKNLGFPHKVAIGGRRCPVQHHGGIKAADLEPFHLVVGPKGLALHAGLVLQGLVELAGAQGVHIGFADDGAGVGCVEVQALQLFHGADHGHGL